MKIGGMIFSRMSSARLPGKAMLQIADKKLLHRVVDRAKCIKEINHICIATSNNKEDDIIVDMAKSLNIDFFRGSLEDVMSRAVNAANFFKYDSILRLCGDRPFFCSNIYDNLIKSHKESKSDITTNTFPRTVPPGLSGEVINIKALEKSLSMTSNPFDREHVTTHIYNNPDQFSINNVQNFKSEEIIKLKLVIDNKLDLDRARWIANKIKEKKCKFDTTKIIELAKKWDKNNLK